MLEEALKKIAILGAAGKMGSGISLLLLQEITRQEAEKLGAVGSGNYSMALIDANEKGLRSLRHYLRDHVRRYAEKNINLLRQYFAGNPKLVSNQEIVEVFVQGALDNIRLETETTQANHSSLIFEAIVEDMKVKAQVLGDIDRASSHQPYYFTNTSSIPINILSQKSGIDGRIIGFHFYNPPAVQKLLEIIPAENTDSRLVNYATEIASRLEKIAVISKDVAGFIGNGHFMREVDFACRKVHELEKTHSTKEAIVLINLVTQEFLIRPMGIFQLIDYVGLDVAEKVLNVMSSNLALPFESQLIRSFIAQGVKGGQNPDGSQKNGIFQYDHTGIIKIWEDGEYVNLPKNSLGDLPVGFKPWKIMQREINKNVLLEAYFKNLFAANTEGTLLAQEYLHKSREIARGLVSDGVAKSAEDVNTVLKNGFYHLYGPINAWIPEEARSR